MIRFFFLSAFISALVFDMACHAPQRLPVKLKLVCATGPDMAEGCNMLTSFVSRENMELHYLVLSVITVSTHTWGAGIAQWLEHRTRD